MIEKMDVQEARILALNPDTPPKQLGALVGLYPEIDKIIAIHPNALQWILEDLANTGNPETLCAVLTNSSIPYGLLKELGLKYPDKLAISSLLPHFISEYPNLLNDIPEVLESPKCPDLVLSNAAASRSYLQKLSVLRNASTPTAIRKCLSPEHFYEDSLARLKEFAELQVNPTLKKVVEIYADTSLPYCLPKFLPIDETNLEHRFADQVIGGFPFTSQSWPWPKNEKGSSMQLLVQLDLKRASDLLGWDCGNGILQVWSPYVDDCEQFLTRVIPTESLSEALDLTYPDDARIESGDEYRLFNFHPKDLPHPRIEWIPFGRMFYPDLETRFIELDEPTNECDPASIEEELTVLDSDFVKLGIPNAAFSGYQDSWPAVYLGGYCLFVGNGWYNGLHNPKQKILLNLTSVSDWPLFHLAVACDRNVEGVPQFSVSVTCTR